MEIASLQAFVAIADEGSFSAAAARLHLTQPAVSKRLQALESELGVHLLDRGGRRNRPTEAGAALLPRARRVLAELEDGRRALSNLAGSVNGRLTVATSHHIGLHRLPPLLREYVTRYPQVQLDMQFTDSELGCAAVARGDAELAIVTLPQQPLGTTVCRPVWDDPLAVVGQRAHPLSGRRLQAAELAAWPAIMPGEVTFTRRLVDSFFAERRVALKLAFSTNYLETIKMMVAVGLGWSVLPRGMIDDELTALQVEGFAVSRTLGVVCHAKHTLSNAAQQLLQLLERERRRAEDPLQG